MKTFSNLIAESFHNFIGGQHEEKMHAHKHEVFNLLQHAYSKIGGIHGNGFKSPDDMVKNIHMWKVHKHEGKIVAAAMYKSKNGRKRVAVATDGSEHGKKALGHIMRDDTTHGRSWGEQSGASLSFNKKHLKSGSIVDHAIPYDKVKHLHDEEIRKAPHDDPECIRHPELKHHFYQRKIGNEWHTKVAIGTPHKHIK